MKRTRQVCTLVLIAFTSGTSSLPALAQSAAPQATAAEKQRDAGKHFHRGVALFNEADYAGALAEFKKAHEIAPNAAVLYNIGQTHFQLRAYAAALLTFERYLAEGGAASEHRAEAEANVETLRSRVGKIDVVAPDGSEVTLDDDVIGRTPLPPILAAVGRRKVVVFKDGQQQLRFAEVSAGETVRLEIKLAGDAARAGAEGPLAPPPAATRSIAPTVMWITTGALAAGALTTGIVALGAASDLSDERAKPAGETTRGKLDDLESKTSTLALVTDILAGAAIVSGGVALYLTLTSKPSAAGRALAPPPARAGVDLGFGAGRIMLEGRF